MDIMSGCVFCQLIEDSDESVVLEHRKGQVYSFVPKNPVVPGHRLFVPYVHRERADEDPIITGFVFQEAARWAATQDSDFNLIVNSGPWAGQTVSHLHVHYVPRIPEDGLLMPWGGVK